MFFQFAFRGEQIVAIKIDTCRARGIGLVSEVGAVEIVGLVDGVGRDGVDLAGDQILRVVAVVNLVDALGRNAFGFKIGQQFACLRLQHDAFVAEIVNALRLACDQHIGGVLE